MRNDTMTLMDQATDLPKPGGHRRLIAMTFRCAGALREIAADPLTARSVLGNREYSECSVFYQGEYRPVVSWIVDDKGATKFGNRWFSLAIYI